MTGRCVHAQHQGQTALRSACHYFNWNADRARFFADGDGCEMQRLGEMLRDECYNDATTIHARKELGKRDF